MKKKAFCAALPYSLPICIGFLFIAMSYGFLMRSRGFSVFYPMAMSAFIFAGSMEFVAVELLLTALCAAARLSSDADGQCAASVLRHLHAGKVQGHGLEKALPDLRHVR